MGQIAALMLLTLIINGNQYCDNTDTLSEGAELILYQHVIYNPIQP